MEFTINDIASLVMILSGWVSVYAGFRSKVAILENDVAGLRDLVTELRQDIKLLLSKNLA